MPPKNRFHDFVASELSSGQRSDWNRADRDFNEGLEEVARLEDRVANFRLAITTYHAIFEEISSEKQLSKGFFLNEVLITFCELFKLSETTNQGMFSTFLDIFRKVSLKKYFKEANEFISKLDEGDLCERQLRDDLVSVRDELLGQVKRFESFADQREQLFDGNTTAGSSDSLRVAARFYQKAIFLGMGLGIDSQSDLFLSLLNMYSKLMHFSASTAEKLKFAEQLLSCAMSCDRFISKRHERVEYYHGCVEACAVIALLHNSVNERNGKRKLMLNFCLAAQALGDDVDDSTRQLLGEIAGYSQSARGSTEPAGESTAAFQP
ncbi:MAG: hypothetical protein COV52_01475 [Gammaproteobacteria bacterium CG11_big_fil_rev_8_21_14_0_20_46_22]|nr:MAG: hypothetical protein COW05_03200 [Gammaproteobacteria bacterium CG12_big_fil_rev_8_21_14_0_65_46_12]PIR11925.1 MAG: hypothetical protein COV52_01475 [Gammaproteobacteria bacterium CG11_big_fil_rev_8_21_14_0_20_46_22]